MTIADIFSPAWDLLLVRRDPPSRVVGVGFGGGSIVAPDTTRETGRCHTGVVLKAGPQAHEVYEPGIRVVFAPFSATSLAQVGGASDDFVLLPPAEVLCLLDGKEDLEQQLAESWTEHVLAPPGALLLERAERPIHRGRIELPVGASTATRSAEAEVVAVGPDVTGCFKKGDAVLLGGGVGRSVGFGIREERRFYRASPRQVLGLLEEPLPQIVTPEESPLRHAADIMQPTEIALDEGDPRLPK